MSDLSCTGVMLQCVSHSEALDQDTSQAQTPSGCERLHVSDGASWIFRLAYRGEVDMGGWARLV